MPNLTVGRITWLPIQMLSLQMPYLTVGRITWVPSQMSNKPPSLGVYSPAISNETPPRALVRGAETILYLDPGRGSDAL